VDETEPRRKRRHARRGRQEPGIVKPTSATNHQITLGKRFKPRFWADADQRVAVVRLIKRRYEQLKRDTGVDSVQKDLLCQRAAFLSSILETQEVEAAEGEGLDIGSYTQATNALSGLLLRLGLDKKVKNVTDLSTYLEERKK